MSNKVNGGKQLVVFDFDGTISYSIPVVVNILEQLAPRYGLKTFTYHELLKLRQHADSSSLLSLYNIDTIKLPFMIYSVRKQLKHRLAEIGIFCGIREMLWQLKKQNNIIGILTTNDRGNVETILKRHGLNIFDFIETALYWGKSKQLKRLKKKWATADLTTYYIGDETRDILAAKQAEVVSIGVTWGIHTEKTLLKYQPDYIAQSTKAILQFICEKHYAS